jgi:5-methyltetrahydropteroyltriglutamate--homocysteine methyltransferase
MQEGRTPAGEFARVAERALRDTIRLIEETGSPVITDGEQTKSSFATYPLEGVSNVAPERGADSVQIDFTEGRLSLKI